MRKWCATLGLVVVSLAALPAPADAFFWAWLDDLSGPRYWGAEMQWKVYCRSESVETPLARLQRYQQTIHDAIVKWEEASEKAAANQSTRRAVEPYNLAIAHAKKALGYIDLARTVLETQPGSDTSGLVRGAANWFNLALKHGAFADGLARGEEPAVPPPATPDDVDQGTQRMMAAAPPVGVMLSLCDAKPGHRETQYLDVTVGYMWDKKPENRAFKHRLVTLGASYHRVVSPYLTIGGGAGVGMFSSRVSDSFQKLYLQPAIIDIRPAMFFQARRNGSEWWKVAYIRASVVVFPTGFKAGSFGNQSERYRAEVLKTIGLHADLSPIIQEMVEKWRTKR